MRKIQFITDYDYRPSHQPYVTIAYKAGSIVEVEEECFARATFAGAATLAEFADYPLAHDAKQTEFIERLRSEPKFIGEDEEVDQDDSQEGDDQEGDA
ncbi:hypothetical protein K7W03_20465 [Sphingobium sp. PNB]|uniref:hypothetical protein n=1 Tax=Sphingobium sp. PNB TaxID=863934 RepID=UPI001CA44340|nr:hypothetical protein [Sphingobium sp. PNB]MCB4861969.1 hypothetical protein [Sphingobium sp. PNB]